jgi:hypothetical protein
LVCHIKDSNIMVLMAPVKKRMGLKIVVIPAGVILVPDWRHGGDEPCYMIYKDLNAALRGGANALDTQRMHFGLRASSSDHYEMVFGAKLGEKDVQRLREEGEKRVADQAGIIKSLGVWHLALWTECENERSIVQVIKEGAEGVAADQTSLGYYHLICERAKANLVCEPFRSVINAVLDRPVWKSESDVVAGMKEIVSLCASCLRDQALYDADTCLSRAGSLLRRRRRLGQEVGVLGLLNSAANLLTRAKEAHLWSKTELKTVNGSMRYWIRKTRKAVSKKDFSSAQRHLKTARKRLNSLIGR